MTEQQQAELLAAWLADPNAPIPDGLDPDVVEAVIALHPERAPAPRVTADSILALVEEGPLAPTVVEPPPLPAPANQGGNLWKWALAGSSGLVAAALALVVVGVGVVGTTTTFSRSASEPAEQIRSRHLDGEGVAAAPVGREVDTGVADEPRTVAARRPSPRPAARPSPAPSPIVAEKSLQAPVDAVAMAEDEEGADFMDDAVEAEPSADLDADAAAGPMAGGSAGLGGLSAGQTRGGEAAYEPIPEAAESAKQKKEEKSAVAARAQEERAKRDASDAAEERRARSEAEREAAERAALEAERKAMEQERKVQAMRQAEEAARSASQAARETAAAPAAPVRTRPRPRKGKGKTERALADEAPSSEDALELASPPPPPASPAMEPSATSAQPSDPDLANARAALVAGDASAALNHIARGLQRHPNDSRIRQQLFQAQGDAYTALGQTEAAATAYRLAREIAARL